MERIHEGTYLIILNMIQGPEISWLTSEPLLKVKLLTSILSRLWNPKKSKSEKPTRRQPSYSRLRTIPTHLVAAGSRMQLLKGLPSAERLSEGTQLRPSQAPHSLGHFELCCKKHWGPALTRPTRPDKAYRYAYVLTTIFSAQQDST